MMRKRSKVDEREDSERGWKLKEREARSHGLRSGGRTALVTCSLTNSTTQALAFVRHFPMTSFRAH
jgi:hypothetical protein